MPGEGAWVGFIASVKGAWEAWKAARVRFDGLIDDADAAVRRQTEDRGRTSIDVGKLIAEGKLNAGGYLTAIDGPLQDGRFKVSDEMRSKVAVRADGSVLIADGDAIAMSYLRQLESALVGLPEGRNGKLSQRQRVPSDVVLRANGVGGLQSIGIRAGERFENGPQQEAYNLFQLAASRGANDIHVEILGDRATVWGRVDRQVVPFNEIRWSAEKTYMVCGAVYQAAEEASKGRSGGDFIPRKRQEFKVSDRSILPDLFQMARCAHTPTWGGKGYYLAIRLQRRGDKLPPSAQALGLSAAHERVARRMFRRSNGGVLVVGPMGSGKSTFLAWAVSDAMQWYEEQGLRQRLLTLEDPIELAIHGATQTELGPGEKYDDAAANLMRLDANRLVLSELRTEKTVRAYFQGVSTGHAAASTIHAVSPIGTFVRLKGMAVPTAVWSSHELWAGVVALALTRTLCPNCSRRVADIAGVAGGMENVLDGSVWDWLTVGFGEDGAKKRAGDLLVGTYPNQKRNLDCEICGGRGYKGVTSIAGMLEPDADMLELLVAERYGEAYRQWLDDPHALTMGRHAEEKVNSGIIDPNDVAPIMGDHVRMMRKIRHDGRLH
jgi:type II secretory ATPase GspE/PulE/Tfp pilus assembly ATPase PilB-like protein